MNLVQPDPPSLLEVTVILDTLDVMVVVTVDGQRQAADPVLPNTASVGSAFSAIPYIRPCSPALLSIVDDIRIQRSC